MRGTPWGGWVPDIEPSLLELTDGAEVKGLYDDDGRLTPDNGFFRLGTSQLPLGTVTYNATVAAEDITFVDGGGGNDTITRSQPGGAGSFVTDGFANGDTINISGTVSNNGALTLNAAVAAGTLTVPTASVTAEGPLTDLVHISKALPASAANAESVIGLCQFVPRNTTVPTQIALGALRVGPVGHMYSLSGGIWSVVPYAPLGAMEAGGFTATADNIVDWEYFPHLGSSGIILIATNEESNDQILSYPDTNGDYSDISIEGTNPAGVARFNCRSITNFTDRILCFNTIEDGTRFRNRLRWSNVGALDFTALGSGSADALELEGEGVRAETIGSNKCALYFEDGVAFLRHTNLRTAPFAIDYISHRRGLIGTRALVNLGSGVHFGIFSDGWFFLDDTGRWEEAGLFRKGNSIRHKWLRTFYDNLDWQARNRVVIEYDERKRLIRIAWPDVDAPSNHPNNVWNYDLESDTIWPDSYGAHAPTYWGSWENTSTALTWANIDATVIGTTTITDWAGAEALGLAWGHGADVGQIGIVHGTSSGLVFQHDPVWTTRDGVTFTYQWRSHQVDRGSFSNRTQADRLYLEYERLGTTPNISVSMLLDDSSDSGTIIPNKGIEGSTQTDYIHGHSSGRRLGYEISGNVPTVIKGFELHVLDEQTEEVNPQT